MIMFVKEVFSIAETYKFRQYQPSIISFYNKQGELLLREPTLVTVDTQKSRVIAIGLESQDMERQNEVFVTGSVFQNGVVAEFVYAQTMVWTMIKKAYRRKWAWTQPKIAVCIAKDLTDVECRVLGQIFRSGTKRLLIIDKTYQEARSHISSIYDTFIEISEPCVFDRL